MPAWTGTGMMSVAARLPWEQAGSKVREWHRDRLAVVYQLSELRRGFCQFKGGFRCARLRSLLMAGQDEPRDLAALVVPQAGWLERAEDPWEPYRLLDQAGILVGPVAAFLRDLQASGRPETTLRAYAIALLRWFRFLWATGVPWDQATRAGVPNPVTGKAPPGSGYAPATVTHSESVLRGFYDFHLETGTGPIVNPFPLARGRRGRAHAHHNPMEPYRGERSGRYRPRLARRAPHHIPEEKFNELFAALGSHRDRALVAFWVSTG